IALPRAIRWRTRARCAAPAFGPPALEFPIPAYPPRRPAAGRRRHMFPPIAADPTPPKCPPLARESSNHRFAFAIAHDATLPPPIPSAAPAPVPAHHAAPTRRASTAPPPRFLPIEPLPIRFAIAR